MASTVLSISILVSCLFLTSCASLISTEHYDLDHKSVYDVAKTSYSTIQNSYDGTRPYILVYDDQYNTTLGNLIDFINTNQRLLSKDRNLLKKLAEYNKEIMKVYKSKK